MVLQFSLISIAPLQLFVPVRVFVLFEACSGNNQENNPINKTFQ